MRVIPPLRDNWSIKEDEGWVPDQILARVNSEDNYTNAKGFPLIKCKDIVNNRDWRKLLKDKKKLNDI